MKKVIVLFFIIVICSFRIDAQTIRVNNGFLITSLNSSNYDILNNHLISYTSSIGLDYLHRPYFSVSSEIGYTKIGGSDKIFIQSDVNTKKHITIKEKKDYLQLNTTFRIKMPLGYNYLYMGIGPNISLLLNNNKFSNLNFSGYKLSQFLYGIKSEIGANVNLKDKFVVGLNAAYFRNVNNYAESELNNMKNSIFSFTFMIGYEL